MGGEEIPPGGWRGGDDKVNSEQHYFLHYSVGGKCSTGQVIKSIIGRSPDIIVFITEDDNLRYESTKNISTKMSNIIKNFHLYLSQIMTSLPKNYQTNASIKLGHSLYTAFQSNEEKEVSTYFSDVDKYIKVKSKEKVKIYYLLSAFLSSSIISAITIYLYQLFLYENEYSLLFLVGILSGTWGALVSIFQRNKRLIIDPFSSIFYLSFQASIRILLGSIFGVLFILAYKAKLILGVLDGNLFIISIFAIMSGFSERFIPELLNKLDYEK